MDIEPTQTFVDSEAVDEALRAALRAEPSPEFRARVRTRIAEEPPPSRWTIWSAAAVIGAAAVILMVAIVAGRSTRPQAPVRTTAGQPALPAGPANDVALPGEPTRAPPAEPVHRQAVEPRVRLAGQRPGVPRTDERQALREFLNAVDQGTITLAIPPVARAADDRSMTIANLAISPISISALAVDPITQ
jgi:hypothetical protein